VNIIKVWIENPPKDFKYHSDFMVEDNDLEYVFVQEDDISLKSVDLTRIRSITNKVTLLLQLAFAVSMLQKRKKNHFNLDWKYVLEDPKTENKPTVFIKPRYTQVC